MNILSPTRFCKFLTSSLVQSVVFAALAGLLTAGCAESETPEKNARTNLTKAMGETTSVLARNVSCFSPIEKTEAGIDVIKCSYEISATALQHSYFEMYCETRLQGQCFWKHTAFPSRT